MPIKEIITKQSELLKATKLKFGSGNSNVLSLIGMNGSGKSIFLNYLKNKQNELKVVKESNEKDMRELFKLLEKDLSNGKLKKEFKSWVREFQEQKIKLVSNLEKELDAFIWKRFLNICKIHLSEVKPSKEVKEIIEKINIFSKKNLFSKKSILKAWSQYDNYIKIDTHLKLAKKINIFLNKYKNTEIKLVDINKKPLLSGNFEFSNIDSSKISLSRTLRNDKNKSFIINLLKIINKQKNFIEVNYTNLSTIIKKDDHIKLNDWFKSYISQNIILKINIENENFNIKIIDEYSKNELNYDQLSSGGNWKINLHVYFPITTTDPDTIIGI